MSIKVFKDLYKRKYYQKKEIYYLILKYIYIKNLKENNKTLFYNFFFKKKFRVKNQIKKRCILTNRGRGLVSILKCSRIKFKEYALLGSSFGISKASW